MSENSTNGIHEELALLREEIARLRRDARARPSEADDAIVRGILDSVRCGLVHIAEDGRILYGNSFARGMPWLAGTNLSGHSLREFMPQTIWQDGSPCAFDDYPAIKCIATGQPQPPVTIGIRGPGETIAWVSVSDSPFRNPITGLNDGVLATLVDISRPKRVEESLRQTEDRYQRLVDDAPDAILVHQAGVIAYINEAGVRMWGGSSPSDFIGREILDFVHPRYREKVTRRMHQVMRGTTAPLAQHTNVRLDGRIVRVEVTAMPCVYDGKPSVQVILRDVTRRTRTEKQVRKQREILRRFFDGIPALVGFFDRAGRLKIVNRQWKRVFGENAPRSLSEILAASCADAAARTDVVEHLLDGNAGWRDCRITSHSGRTRDISWVSIVLSDGTRIAIGQDVTARKAAEEAVSRHQAELEQRVEARTEELSRKNVELEGEIAERRRAEKQLQEKQRFLERTLHAQERDRQLVAYEIHDTFLQGVIGALMYIDTFCATHTSDETQVPAQLELAGNLLRKSIDDARRMISGLRPPIIDEQGIIAAIEYLISEMNARGLDVEFSHSMTPVRLAPVVEANIFRIVQEALTNFERHSQSSWARVTIAEIGKQLRIEIRDTGMGFDAARSVERHFGLQGIQERARLVGGSAAIESTPGKGTSIVVELPLLAEKRDR